MPRAIDYDGDEGRSSIIDQTTGAGAGIMATKARNWLITQNNAEKYGLDVSQEGILKLLQPLIEKGRISYINHCREQSLQPDQNSCHTRHDHFVLRFPNQAQGCQVHKYFPHAALQACQENLLSIVKYVQKDTSGHWYKVHPEKLGEKLPDAEADYWQWGELSIPSKPSEKAQKKENININELIMAAIIEGRSDADIMVTYPITWRRPAELRKVRFSVMSEKYRSLYRDLTVIYIQANMPPKQLYKLYSVDKNTYVVNDYTHPWDSYCAEKTVVLMDFRGQFPWPELRRLLSGNYCTLPARFSDAVACYTTIIIISPISLQDFKSIKTYESNNMESYLTHIRTYDDLDDLGSFFVRDAKTLRWTRQYLLSSSSEDKKED